MSKCGLKNIICLTDFINTDNFYNLEFCKKKDNSCILKFLSFQSCSTLIRHFLIYKLVVCQM